MIDENEKIEAHFARIAALIGERSRAVMLWNLLDGRAYTAMELATCANISKQSCSNHLSQLVSAGILRVEKQGRHRYFTFASDRTAQVVENVAYLMPSEIRLPQEKMAKASAGIWYARTCYDHLAGRIGVTVFQALESRTILSTSGSEVLITPFGQEWFAEFGIDLPLLAQQKRKMVYGCMDWSERKNHLGGALGSAFFSLCIKKDWIRRTSYGREVILTPLGKAELGQRLSIEL